MADEERNKWNIRYDSPHRVMGDAPNELALEVEPELPTSGRALEIACGEGQLAIWLAQRGLHVDALDISSVGLATLERHATCEGLADRIRTIEHDLDEGMPACLASVYNLVTCFHYSLLDHLPSVLPLLAPGGMLLVELLTSAAPSGRVSHRYLAPPGELLKRVTDLTVLFYREGIIRGKSQAQLLAARPPARRPPDSQQKMRTPPSSS